jgi:hypothetical protein
MKLVPFKVTAKELEVMTYFNESGAKNVEAINAAVNITFKLMTMQKTIVPRSRTAKQLTQGESLTYVKRYNLEMTNEVYDKFLKIAEHYEMGKGDCASYCLRSLYEVMQKKGKLALFTNISRTRDSIKQDKVTMKLTIGIDTLSQAMTIASIAKRELKDILVEFIEDGVERMS